MPDLFDSQAPSPRKAPFCLCWLNFPSFPSRPSTPPLLRQALAAQTTDSKLAAIFKPIAEQLTANEEKIVSELLAVQGKPVDIGGYSFLSGIAL